jgi:hypothetical protein
MKELIEKLQELQTQHSGDLEVFIVSTALIRRLRRSILNQPERYQPLNMVRL